MTHYFEQGFSVRQPMWHGLGTVLQEYPGREEAMRLAGHDFQVKEREIFVPQGPIGSQSVGPNLGASFRRIDSHKALVAEGGRFDGGLLGVVGESYGVVQNDTLWDIVDAIVAEPNVRYETAGVLKGGSVLWVLAWLDEPVQIDGDDSPVYPFVTVSAAHDGSAAIQARATSIRVVCWNTLSASEAEAERHGRAFTFRHTRNVMDRISEARDALQGIRAEHAEFVALAEELATIPVSEAGRRMFIERFIPAPTVLTDRQADNLEKARATVRSILSGSHGTLSDQVRGTAYGLVQAGVEYLDHYRPSRGEGGALKRSLLRTEPAKLKLADLAREAASV